MDAFKLLNEVKKDQLEKIDFEKNARNKRQTKEWRTNRSEFLQDKNECEWCGDETDTFDVHHTWSRSFSREWMKSTDEAFVSSDSFDEELTNNREECPECGLRSYRERSTKTPRYRCDSCKSVFSEPLTVDGSEAITEDRYDNKPYTTDEYYERKATWVDNNRDVVMSAFMNRYQDLLDEYAELREDQVVAICSKCHYKEEKTKKRLCNSCETNWYNPSTRYDNMCWECIVEKKNLSECDECSSGWYQSSKYNKCNQCR